MTNVLNIPPLVSVIITTYNYACYLPRAIQSVLAQTYTNIEIIIVDDGSTDDTASVVLPNPSIQYFYQHNQGLSAARNNGLRRSHGRYLVFLDADDWLEPDAIQNNLKIIIHQPHTAFVSGNYYLLHAETNLREEVTVTVDRNHFEELLRRNYIGMHASVMFQRWVLQEIEYDENLTACEDYDLYLRIGRKYPVIHHQKFIATYYFHKKGLSHNYGKMMDAMITVMKKQAPFIESAEEIKAYEKGSQQWRDYHALLVSNP
ncbi:MAG: glycosyltransferase family 2 protein [Bacteroidota bacterium]|nr:glycosyltransferase family 2 protein [Bacteroidota bacterium]